VAEEKKADPAEVRGAFDILFGLLDYIDECNDDVIFLDRDLGAAQSADRKVGTGARSRLARADPERVITRSSGRT
jgi:hypothetical protein